MRVNHFEQGGIFAVSGPGIGLRSVAIKRNHRQNDEHRGGQSPSKGPTISGYGAGRHRRRKREIGRPPGRLAGRKMAKRLRRLTKARQFRAAVRTGPAVFLLLWRRSTGKTSGETVRR